MRLITCTTPLRSSTDARAALCGPLYLAAESHDVLLDGNPTGVLVGQPIRLQGVGGSAGDLLSHPTPSKPATGWGGRGEVTDRLGQVAPGVQHQVSLGQVCALGKVKVKVAPSCSMLSADARPPCFRMMRRTVASPTPVPVNCCSV